MPEQSFSGFELLGELGRGGMGVVYVARQVSLDRQVALKTLRPGLAVAEGSVDRFRLEARGAARVNHPNLVQVYEVGTEGGTCYIAMELVEGESLSALIAREGGLDYVQAAGIASQLSSALGALHGAGVVHRDLKPSNILVRPDGVVKLTDFGVALLRGGASRLTEAGQAVGTAQYMSPEQARGEALDGRSDIYSLGAVLYEMLVGHPPFEDREPLVVMRRHCQEPVPSVRRVRADVPDRLVEVVERCLAKGAGERYQRGEALSADLDHVRLEMEFAALSAEGATGPLTALYSTRTLVSLRAVSAAEPGIFVRLYGQLTGRVTGAVDRDAAAVRCASRRLEASLAELAEAKQAGGAIPGAGVEDLEERCRQERAEYERLRIQAEVKHARARARALRPGLLAQWRRAGRVALRAGALVGVVLVALLLARGVFARRVTLEPPYPEVYQGSPQDEIQLAHAVREVCRQAGRGCDWDEHSRDVARPGAVYVQPRIARVPFKRALRSLLEPHGLTYAIEEDTVVVERMRPEPRDLIQAAMYGTERQACRLIESGSPVGETDANGRTPLHWAARRAHAGIVSLLLAAGADVEACDADGAPPLAWAAASGKEEVVRPILDAGARVDAADANGWTALHHAVISMRELAVRLLLEAGSDPIALNAEGRTPLSMALSATYDPLAAAMAGWESRVPLITAGDGDPCPLAGLRSIAVQRVQPGRIEKLSDAFKPLLVLEYGGSRHVVVGLARHGAGKVVIASHPGLVASPDLTPGYIRWLGLRPDATLWVLSSDDTSVDALREACRGRCQMRLWQDRGRVPSAAPHDAILLDAMFLEYSLVDPDTGALREWVRNGGGLIIVGAGWVWQIFEALPAERVPHTWVNELIRPFGAEYGSDAVYWPEGGAATVLDEEGRRLGSLVNMP